MNQSDRKTVSKHTKEEMIAMMNRPLDYKIHLAEAQALDFFQKLDGKVYVSFSGGKDSTVLLHIVRSILPQVVAVFCDTGLEFPEIREFVKEFENVVWLKPSRNFREEISINGYPLISKEVASTVVGAIRNPNSLRARKLDGSMKGLSKFDSSKYQYLTKAPFKLNDKCCNTFKKEPFKKYNKESGMLGSYIGVRVEESMLREKNWIRYGCNVYRDGYNRSMLLSLWKDKDIDEYIRRFDLKIAKPYEMGYKRTGCVFCAFGSHLESYPNRFQMLQKTHQNLHEYLLRDFDAGGLGMRKPLEYIGVNPIDNQIDIFEYMESEDKEKISLSDLPKPKEKESEEEYINRCANNLDAKGVKKSFDKLTKLCKLKYKEEL